MKALLLLLIVIGGLAAGFGFERPSPAPLHQVILQPRDAFSEPPHDAALAAVSQTASPTMPGDAAMADQHRIPEAVQKVFRKLRIGMSYQDAEQAIQPVLLESAWRAEGGSGHSERIYHLQGDWQLVLKCDGYPKFDDVIEIRDLETKRPWRGYRWDPGEKDKAAVVEIAVEALRDELNLGRNPAARFPTNPVGMHEFGDDLSVELEITPGTKTPLSALAGEGRWQNHKVVRVNFLEAEHWVYQVDVDLNDRKAVPSQWTPTNQEIARARVIADPALREFLEKDVEERGKVEVRGWGEYDHGPLRRILVLVYSKQEDGNQSLKYVEVDFDNLKLNSDLP